MHTPEQASSLWCPMVRIGVTAASGGPSTINDPTSIPEFSGRCIAEKCAMWRMEGSTTYKFNPKFFTDLPSTKPTGRGYCGLADRPEVMP